MSKLEPTLQPLSFFLSALNQVPWEAGLVVNSSSLTLRKQLNRHTEICMRRWKYCYADKNNKKKYIYVTFRQEPLKLQTQLYNHHFLIVWAWSLRWIFCWLLPCTFPRCWWSVFGATFNIGQQPLGQVNCSGRVESKCFLWINPSNNKRPFSMYVIMPVPTVGWGKT